MGVKKLLIGLFILMVLVNLMSVFSPELGFDALWYHLTLTKLFLLQHRWFYPGGLLYYSAMPRLGEMIYLPFLSMVGTTGPKIVQFVAGLVSAWLTFKIARVFLKENQSLLAALLFYCTWLVSWQSGSAYVDLIRTVFETGAIYLLVKNEQDKKLRNIWGSGVLFGLAIGTKWHALASLVFGAILFTPVVVFPALLVASPWFAIAMHFTGHPLYPLNEPFMKEVQLSQVPPNFMSIGAILKRWLLLPLEVAKPIDDLLNPIFGLLVPLGVLFAWKKGDKTLRKLVIYALLGLLLWQIIPPPSSRYLLPYLPVLSVLGIYAINNIRFQKVGMIAVILSVIVIIGGRFYSNLKFLPYLLHQQSQNQFLTVNASRLPNTFIDADSWVETNIPKTDKVLVDKLHNLYYLPLNFDDATWADKTFKYPYLITVGQDPKEIKGVLVHTNPLGIQVFKL